MSEKASILMVDDDQSTRRTLTLIFRKKGYEIESVGTGRDAIEKARERFFNIAFLDIKLPDMKGVELIAPLKEMHPDMVMIMVTAYASLETAVHALNQGASAYIIKPLNMDEVLAKVKEAVEKQQLVMENRILYRDIQQELAERKRTQEALEVAYDELKETQEMLIQSEKLAALGRFSSGLAHEIKNPLGIVLGAVGFLEKRMAPADEDIITALSKIKESVRRADQIIQGLLSFSRPSNLDTESLRPVDIIKDTLSLLQYRIPLKHIRISTQFSDDGLYIGVDRNQIQQVLFNVLMNAVEAMPKTRGEITIKTYKTTCPKNDVQSPACVIQIKDNGEGISRHDLSRIYEPFYTTKRDKKGTGLGLSISKKIVENHKGKLTIDSEKGRGTDVKLIFPIERRRQK
jgi:signal transduction histidine kinase